MAVKTLLNNFITKVKSDGHVPVALLVFAITTIITTITKRDLGPGYVNSIYAFYGFLAGDKFVQNKYQPDDTTQDNPDQPKQ